MTATRSLVLVAILLAGCESKNDDSFGGSSGSDATYTCNCKGEGTFCGPGTFTAASCSMARSMAENTCEEQVEELTGYTPTDLRCGCSGQGCPTAECPCGEHKGACINCDL